MRHVKTLFFFLFFTMPLCGCNDSAKPLDIGEVTDFARKLETSVNKKDPSFFDDAIDKDEISKRANMPDSRAASRIKLGSGIVSLLSSKGSFLLVKKYEKDGIWHLLFRLLVEDNMALNYYDFELKRRNAKVKIIDGYAYNLGQKFSEVLGDLNSQMNEIERESRQDKDRWLDLIGVMRKKIMDSRFKEAYDMFQTIPPDVRKIKIMQIIHVTICAGISAEIQQAAFNEYKNLYPNEPNIALLQMSSYLLQQNYESALTAIDDLDKMINKDPLLDYHRSICFKMLGKNEQQKECLVRLVKNVPGFEDGLIEMIAVSIENENKTEATKWIKEFRLHSAYDQDRLDAVLESYGWE